MPAIVFETNGLIDIRAFTMMGLSVKPNSTNPIGQFGTGLKYAIAVLVRMGAEPILWIGKDKYTFQKKQSEFRGALIEMISMKMERWSWKKPRYHELPFSTQYGKFWEPWMAYRELEANTRDEGGGTFEAYGDVWEAAPEENKTLFVIDHEDFYNAYINRDQIFLPKAQTKIRENTILEVFDGPSQYIYYRGMRVDELDKQSMYTYNLLTEVELTEDRTLKYEFQAKQAIGNFVLGAKDKEFVQQILTAGADWYEDSIDFDDWKRPRPGQTFIDVVRSKPSGLTHKATTVLDIYYPPEKISREVFHPMPWKEHNDWIVDNKGRNVVQKPAGYLGNWHYVAKEIVRIMNKSEQPTEEMPF